MSATETQTPPLPGVPGPARTDERKRRSSTAATSIDVRLSRSGRTLVWDSQDGNLLDFAERQDVAVDSGCRSGSCASCETWLVSGTEDIYKIYAESLRGADHWRRILAEAQTIVGAALEQQP